MRVPQQPAVGADDRAADALQAAYFRELLADRLASINEDLASFDARLAALLGSGDQFALGALRRQIRFKEGEHRELGRLISALDRRFGTRWTNQLSVVESG
jgi:hypothetical protein